METACGGKGWKGERKNWDLRGRGSGTGETQTSIHVHIEAWRPTVTERDPREGDTWRASVWVRACEGETEIRDVHMCQRIDPKREEAEKWGRRVNQGVS